MDGMNYCFTGCTLWDVEGIRKTVFRGCNKCLCVLHYCFSTWHCAWLQDSTPCHWHMARNVGRKTYYGMLYYFIILKLCMMNNRHIWGMRGACSAKITNFVAHVQQSFQALICLLVEKPHKVAFSTMYTISFVVPSKSFVK